MNLICELASIKALIDSPADCFAWLSPSEVVRLNGFGNPGRRLAFLAGRRLARLLLSRRLGPQALPPLTIDAAGRSGVEGRPELFLSISHSGDWVGCAMADAPIGLDIEAVGRRRDFSALAQLVHSPSQCRSLADAGSDAERAQRFYQWWTLKEAWFKRQGLGLDLARMPQLEYLSCERGPAVCSVMPGSGLMLALDGPACAGASLPTDLAGEAPAWRAFQYGCVGVATDLNR